MSEASLSKAIDAAGGQAPLSRALGITYQAIDSWKKRGVPPSRVLDVERHTGVSRHELRPDIFGSSPAATGEADVGAAHTDDPSRAAPADQHGVAA